MANASCAPRAGHLPAAGAGRDSALRATRGPRRRTTGRPAVASTRYAQESFESSIGRASVEGWTKARPKDAKTLTAAARGRGRLTYRQQAVPAGARSPE